MDFYTIKERSAKHGVVEVFPDFRVTRSQDLMVRSKSFYAVWDQEAGMWSTDEYDVQKLIDADTDAEKTAQQMAAARKALDKAFFAMLSDLIAEGKASADEVATLLLRFA
mgnify:CR=1 FL=1